MDENKLEFTVDSHLLGELGERLVTRNYIALSELVKNAYDADATKITIKFINTKRGGKKTAKSEIHLIDDGHGMTSQQVKDYWMRVATPYKIREPISPRYGRRKTGDKGIGRFACRRLAKKLTLKTIAEVPESKELEWTKVNFDWDKFEPGTTLTEISCDYQTKRIKERTSGLTLILTGLVELWSDAEFNILKRKLLTLPIVKGIKRKGYEEDPGFQVVLDAPDFPKGVGVLVDQYMDAGWGKLNGYIERNGNVNLNLTAKRIGTHTYKLPELFKNLKGIDFEIAWVPTVKEYFRDPKILTKGLAELTREQCGVRVYLDGFRIYPYGDPDDDWLGIDKDVARRWGTADSIFEHIASTLGIDFGRAMLNHPQNRHLLGRIYISSHPKSYFIVKTDREGFIKNDAFDDLTRCIRLSLQWCVLHYNKFLISYATEEAKKAERLFRRKIKEVKDKRAKLEEIAKPLVEKAVDVLTKEAIRAHNILPKEEKEESKERVEAAAEMIHRTFTRTETYLNTLRSVASTGTLLFVFSHEIRQITARLDTHANTINRIMRNLPKKDRKDLKKFADDLRETRDRLDKQLSLVSTFSKTSPDIKRKAISIKKVCNEILEGFEYFIEHYRLNQPKLDIPDSLRTAPMMEPEVYSIILNLLSNAIKADLAGGGKDILIQAQKEDGKIVLRVFDDGIGISGDFQEDVFEPLVADPAGHIYEALQEKIPDEDLAALGRGSGLGLTIIKGIVETYGGKVRFVDTSSPWKTCVEVILP